MTSPLRLRSFRHAAALALALATLGVAGCTQVNPITLGERIAEDRSAGDIAKDTEIFAKASTAMAEQKTLAVSNMVYEQTLLAYGVMDDRKKMEALHAAYRNIAGVKRLYWEVRYMSEAQQKSHLPPLLNVAETTKTHGEIEANWLKADGVASPNFRVGIDPLGHAFLLGRAHSAKEKARVIEIVRGVANVREVTDHIYIKP